MNLFNRKKDDILSPAGKLKGEMNGQFEAFYLAVDKDGGFFMNRNLQFVDKPYAKANGWSEISSKQLAEYLQHLSFVNKKSKSLKP